MSFAIEIAYFHVWDSGTNVLKTTAQVEGSSLQDGASCCNNSVNLQYAGSSQHAFKQPPRISM